MSGPDSVDPDEDTEFQKAWLSGSFLHDLGVEIAKPGSQSPRIPRVIDARARSPRSPATSPTPKARRLRGLRRGRQIDSEAHDLARRGPSKTCVKSRSTTPRPLRAVSWHAATTLSPPSMTFVGSIVYSAKLGEVPREELPSCARSRSRRLRRRGIGCAEIVELDIGAAQVLRPSRSPAG